MNKRKPMEKGIMILIILTLLLTGVNAEQEKNWWNGITGFFIKITGQQTGSLNSECTITGPDMVSPGQNFNVEINAVNTGTEEWVSTRQVLPGGTVPYGHELKGLTSFSKISSATLPNNIQPGQETTFNIIIPAPQILGDYELSYQMKDTATNSFFGENCKKTVKVESITQTTPDLDLRIQSYNILSNNNQLVLELKIKQYGNLKLSVLTINKKLIKLSDNSVYKDQIEVLSFEEGQIEKDDVGTILINLPGLDAGWYTVKIQASESSGSILEYMGDNKITFNANIYDDSGIRRTKHSNQLNDLLDDRLEDYDIQIVSTNLKNVDDLDKLFTYTLTLKNNGKLEIPFVDIITNLEKADHVLAQYIITKEINLPMGETKNVEVTFSVPFNVAFNIGEQYTVTVNAQIQEDLDLANNLKSFELTVLRFCRANDWCPQDYYCKNNQCISSPIQEQKQKLQLSDFQILETTNDLTYSLNLKNIDEKELNNFEVKTTFLTRGTGSTTEELNTFTHKFKSTISKGQTTNAVIKIFNIPSENYDVAITAGANTLDDSIIIPKLGTSGHYAVSTLLIDFFRLSDNEQLIAWDKAKNYILNNDELPFFTAYNKIYFFKNILKNINLLSDFIKKELLILMLKEAKYSRNDAVKQQLTNLILLNQQLYNEEIITSLSEEEKQAYAYLLGDITGLFKDSDSSSQIVRELVSNTINDIFDSEQKEQIITNLNEEFFLFGKKITVINIDPVQKKAIIYMTDE